MAGMTPEPSKWSRIIAADPEHSHRYIQRFKIMEANGADLYGEARTVDAMASRNSRILDAGCGPGRLGTYLHERGHQVVGIDVDPALIEAAQADHPGPTWVVGDLAEMDLPARGIPADFDVIVSAGNVMGFLHPATRRPVLAGFGDRLAPAGRGVVGFGAGRGYDFDDFFADVDAVGLTREQTFATWDLRPFTDQANFVVAVLSAG